MRRLITAVALLPLITYVVLWGTNWLFLLLVTAVSLLCFYEYSGIVAAHGIQLPGPVGYAAGLVVLFVPRNELLVVTLLALVALLLALRADPLPKGLPQAAALLAGVIYIFGTLRCAISLRAIGPYWLFFALGINWIGDTAAYYVGRAAGRHKMAARLSPAKSWEGAAASVAASAAFGFFFLRWLLPEVAPPIAVLLSASGNVAGQIGDLVESALKRGAGVKDSGNLLPGHGGWLDRLDGTLFSLPVVYGLLTLI